MIAKAALSTIFRFLKHEANCAKVISALDSAVTCPGAIHLVNYLHDKGNGICIGPPGSFLS